MSSLRHSIQKRQHRERAQPIERKKHGLLEKHKDYALRAKDFKEKKKRLRALKEKAADRNPDEFHFGMMSAQMKDGRKVVSRGNRVLDMDIARLLKTQDAGYIRTLLQRTKLEREKLEQEIQIVEEGDEPELRLLDQKKKGTAKHTVFVGDVQEQEGFDAKEWFGTDEKGLVRTYNRQKKHSEVRSAAVHDNTPPARKEAPRTVAQEESKRLQEEREKEKRLHKQKVRSNLLEALRQREKALAGAAEELDIQRNRMNNNPGSVTKSGTRIKELIRIRKR